MLVPPRVAACTVVGALTKLILHLSIPTVVWLLCIGFVMPGKRSYVNAVSGCMTQDQIRRQARDRAFLPQPPPPPLSEAPRHSAWADIVDRCDCATQCDPVFAAMPADPPLSGKFLDTINRALGIIELQYRPCPDACASPIEAQPKQPIRQLLLEPLIADFGCTPGFPPLDDAPFTMTETSWLPPAPLLEDAPLALKEVSYYDVYTGDDFTANTEQLTGNFYIGEEYGEEFTNHSGLHATMPSSTRLGCVAHKEEFTNPADLSAIDANLERLEPTCLERLEPKCLDSEVPELESFTAAQHSEFNKVFTNTFAGFTD